MRNLFNLHFSNFDIWPVILPVWVHGWMSSLRSDDDGKDIQQLKQLIQAVKLAKTPNDVLNVLDKKPNFFCGIAG